MSELPVTQDQNPSSPDDPAAPLPHADDAAQPVPEMLGRYPVRRRLGAGAFGTVYEAYDERMQRPVAIKVPSARLLNSQQGREEFQREARNVARLRHENIVTAYDFGEDPNS